MEPALPTSVTTGATLVGNEYGWTIAAFPKALRNAQQLGFACLGGQFEFRVSAGTCEMYWLNADAEERTPEESWKDFVDRSCEQVVERFGLLIRETDFRQQALEWPSLQSSTEAAIASLVFVAYFVSEDEYLSLR